MNDIVWVLLLTRNKNGTRGVNSEIETLILKTFTSKPTSKELDSVMFDEGFHEYFDVIDPYRILASGYLEIEGAVVSLYRSSVTLNDKI